MEKECLWEGLSVENEKRCNYTLISDNKEKQKSEELLSAKCSMYKNVFSKPLFVCLLFLLDHLYFQNKILDAG